MYIIVIGATDPRRRRAVSIFAGWPLPTKPVASIRFGTHHVLPKYTWTRRSQSTTTWCGRLATYEAESKAGGAQPPAGGGDASTGQVEWKAGGAQTPAGVPDNYGRRRGARALGSTCTHARCRWIGKPAELNRPPACRTRVNQWRVRGRRWAQQRF